MLGAAEVSYRNNSEGQSGKQREMWAYRVPAHSKPEDYLGIYSRTGSARRDSSLAMEIREVLAVER